MENAANDNEKLTFITLAAATANVVRYLESTEQKKEEPRADGSGSDTDKQSSEAQRAYVDQRLRELAAFEDRARGKRRNGI